MSDETGRNDTSTEKKAEESRLMARRYFIRAAIYAAPAVASVVAVQHASAVPSPGSCSANGCTGLGCGNPLCNGCPGC